MPASDLKTSFQVIQEGYPRSDIVIRSFTEGILFSHMGLDLLHDLSEQSDIYTAVALKQREYYRFQLGLSGDLQLFMLVEKEYVPDPDEVLYRLLILKSEVPVKLSFNDRLPFPEKYLFFMDQLLNKYTPANASMLYQLAAECGVDTRCHRVICLIRAESNTEPDRRMGNTSVRRLIEALRSKNLITESDIVYSEI